MDSIVQKRYLTGFIWFTLLLSPIYVFSQNAIAQQHTTDHAVLSSWSYYQTNTRNLPIEKIITKFNQKEFKPIRQAVINAGIPEQYYWIHFNVTNKGTRPDSLVINIDNSRLNQLELFEVSGQVAGSLGKSGDFYPFSRRPFFHKNYIYEISLQPGQKKQYFLYVNQVGHACIIPIKLYPAEQFTSVTFNDYLFDGLTFGVLLFVSVLSLLFFLTTRHYLYLYYSLYIKTAIVWFLSYFGLGYQYLWGNYPAVSTLISPLIACLNTVLNIQICQILLRISKTNRPLNDVANGAKLALCAIALFPVLFNLNNHDYTFNHTYLVIFLCSILFAMMIVSYSVIHYALKGFIAARLYLLASLLKAGSIINLALLELGITPAINNMEEFLQAGIFIEITLLTYALATRYTNYKTGTFAKIIEAHEKERSLISKEIHDSISNSLTGVIYGIKNFTRDIDLPAVKKIPLEKIFVELNKVQVEARNISHNTMPDYIKSGSITDIVEIYVEEIQVKANNADGKDALQINFSANKQLINFSEAAKLNIFRIFQELLINIIKHSEATTADFLFSFDKKEMIIIGEDNGIGFDAANQKSNGGMGISNIRSRVELLDGTMVIKSPVHKRAVEPYLLSDKPVQYKEYGTMIRIKIPHKNNTSKNKAGYDY